MHGAVVMIQDIEHLTIAWYYGQVLVLQEGRGESDMSLCRPSPSNQDFYRLIAGYQRGAGDHRVGQ